jgi:hypothetical protein
MNLSLARVQFGAKAVALPRTAAGAAIPGATGSNPIGFEFTTEDFSTADVAYFTQFAGITDTVNPTVVLATGVCTANGATITGSDGEDLYNQTIPTISLGYVLVFKRTDTNGGVLAITGGTSGMVQKLSAGEWVTIRTNAIITADTITFDNSTTAAATVQMFVLARDAA